MRVRGGRPVSEREDARRHRAAGAPARDPHRRRAGEPAELAACRGARGQRRDRVHRRPRGGGGRRHRRGRAVLLAGVAGMVAGALSMAGGEYVSVSTQRDTELATLAQERWELEHLPDQELEELRRSTRRRGSRPTCRRRSRRSSPRTTRSGPTRRPSWGSTRTSGRTLVRGVVLDARVHRGALLPLLAIALPTAGVARARDDAGVVVALTVTGVVSADLARPAARPSSGTSASGCWPWVSRSRSASASAASSAHPRPPRHTTPPRPRPQPPHPGGTGHPCADLDADPAGVVPATAVERRGRAVARVV